MWILHPCDCLGLQLCVGVVFPDGMQLWLIHSLLMQADVGKLDIYVFKEGSFGRKGDELIRARRFCGTGKSSWEKKGISLKPIEFQHQSIQISCSLSKKIHPIEITSCLFLWSTSQNFKKHHNRNRTHLFYTPKNTHQKSLGFFVLKDLLERGNASVGDALAFPLHWSPKGQPQASSPLIRVLSKW